MSYYFVFGGNKIDTGEDVEHGMYDYINGQATDLKSAYALVVHKRGWQTINYAHIAELADSVGGPPLLYFKYWLIRVKLTDLEGATKTYEGWQVHPDGDITIMAEVE